MLAVLMALFEAAALVAKFPAVAVVARKRFALLP
jgi:hypothetical protein